MITSIIIRMILVIIPTMLVITAIFSHTSLKPISKYNSISMAMAFQRVDLDLDVLQFYSSIDALSVNLPFQLHSNSDNENESDIMSICHRGVNENGNGNDSDQNVPHIQMTYCPLDGRIPCGDVDTIKLWCEEQLFGILGSHQVVTGTGTDTGIGTSINDITDTVSGTRVANADPVQGCIKFVGAHIVQEGHYGCCESQECSDFVDKQFDYLYDDYYGDYYNDDDDGDDDDDMNNANDSNSADYSED
eukprot:CAMPEP_0203638430 /NCGR_PEP_ID=MMETSP0088-20131115/4467_1 /ASSEMBLY_ACC=CAM_ASM_001087 /TAXON_ID=426623 /ORGANISM="Chaetoceros affinis, Strain CCMP159" /LENGTH=246 /DNA_ID=CAMNT_0050493071 /DNA_START=63 /DNA_END=800 /DNA_ORIENTATION=+